MPKVNAWPADVQELRIWRLCCFGAVFVALMGGWAMFSRAIHVHETQPLILVSLFPLAALISWPLAPWAGRGIRALESLSPSERPVALSLI